MHVINKLTINYNCKASLFFGTAFHTFSNYRYISTDISGVIFSFFGSSMTSERFQMCSQLLRYGINTVPDLMSALKSNVFNQCLPVIIHFGSLDSSCSLLELQHVYPCQIDYECCKGVIVSINRKLSYGISLYLVFQ